MEEDLSQLFLLTILLMICTNNIQVLLTQSLSTVHVQIFGLVISEYCVYFLGSLTLVNWTRLLYVITCLAWRSCH